MALQNQGTLPVAITSNEGQTSSKKRKIVLDEETYTEKIEKIIERDFFPDLSTLSVQKAYFDALEQNDVVKLRELQMKYGGKCPTTGRSSIAYDSPASFETPESRSAEKPRQAVDKEELRKSPKKDAASTLSENVAGEDVNPLSLDGFLACHTSEDNASFSEILVESERRRQERHAWLFEKEGIQDEAQRKQLALPSMEDQAAITERPTNVDTWTYKPDNHVMYPPKGVELSAVELIEQRKKQSQQVVHRNTHFTSNPFATVESKEMVHRMAVHKAMTNQGKIGHDGRELLAAQTPQVNGFKLMGTPSPAPGVEESPLMTWGEVEGTPVRLDISMTPGPVFRIPDVPKRDKLGMALAEKASKAHRDKKEAALKQVTRRLTSPTSSMSPLERLNGMSPAAQRLASKRLGVRTTTSDPALRASYSPSPTRTPGDKTPIHLTTTTTTPSPRSSRSRSGSESGSGSARSLSSQRSPGLRQSVRKSTPKAASSLTDNLLKLPGSSRKNASDFF